MPDVFHYFGEDLSVSATGDLLLAEGIDLANQRIIRRLMTILGEYVWHPDYGGSVPIRVGEEFDQPLIEAVVREQLSLEAAVAEEPEPTLSVTAIFAGVFVAIKYFDALTGREIDLQFEVTP